jgi:hypothetical protein
MGHNKQNGKLVIDEAQAKMLRELFLLYSENKYGFDKISKILYERGYKNSKGRRFDTTTLTQMVRNPKYKGFYFTNRVKRLDYRNSKQKKVPRDEWISYECAENVPPIVSEELWEKANKILEQRSASFLNKQEDKTIFQHRYAFSGLLFCKEHGTTFHRVAGEKRANKPMWACKTYIKEGLAGCESPLLAESELYAIFKEIVKSFIENQSDILTDLQQEYMEALKENDSEAEISRLEDQMYSVKQRKDKLLDLSINGYIGNDEFLERNEELNAQLEACKNAITALEGQKSKLDDFVEYQNKLRAIIEKKLNLDENIDDYIRLFISKVIVEKVGGDRKHIRLEIYFSYGDSNSTEVKLGGKQGVSLLSAPQKL